MASSTAPAREQIKTAEPACYLSAAQVADLVGVDATTVYRWAASYADMPVLRIGSVVRFHGERLLTWLEAHEQGSRRRRPLVSQKQTHSNIA